MKLITVSVSAPVRVPRVPNFLITEAGATVPIDALSDDELNHIARAWTANLLTHARFRRMTNRRPPAPTSAATPEEPEDPDDTHGEVAGA